MHNLPNATARSQETVGILFLLRLASGWIPTRSGLTQELVDLGHAGRVELGATSVSEYQWPHGATADPNIEPESDRVAVENLSEPESKYALKAGVTVEYRACDIHIEERAMVGHR